MSKTVDKDGKPRDFGDPGLAAAITAKKKRGLPEDPAQWTEEHDLMFFRRYRRMLNAVPPQALRRMGGYLGQMMESAQWPAPPGPSPYPDVGYPQPAGRLMTTAMEKQNAEIALATQGVRGR